jgi:hypothetical protein
MRFRRRLLFPLVALLGAAVVVLPALAASTEAKIEVAENCNDYPNWQCWTSPGANPKPALVKIAVGEVVTFADNTKFAASIVWKGAAPSCSPTVPVSPEPAATGWEGTCRFEATGTYQLEDPSMYYPRATVEVSAAAGTTGTTVGPTTSTSSGSSGSTSGSGSGSPTGEGAPAGAETPLGSLLVGGPSSALALAATQHGRSVRGSIDVSTAAAGGRLEVELLASAAALASSRRSTHVLEVGRVLRVPLAAGKVAFAVALDARARRALRVRGRLALSVKIVLSPAHGTSVMLTRSVVVRG